ncbi:hypothetical protein PT974_06236 [Cladobotryum mycophilum]|uniref:Uncharacterized protein n=1 Tax=Cladobotryum mycophilum TaxID=491253 RepID=A0ABR0SL03_9HYPO
MARSWTTDGSRWLKLPGMQPNRPSNRFDARHSPHLLAAHAPQLLCAAAVVEPLESASLTDLLRRRIVDGDDFPDAQIRPSRTVREQFGGAGLATEFVFFSILHPSFFDQPTIRSLFYAARERQDCEMSISKTPIGTYRLLKRKWPTTALRTTRWLMLVEFIGLVPLLVIFGLAQPDLYRTTMWQIGFDNHLNSNPNMVLYAYANHRPLPEIPFIWSRKLTDFNVAISVISLFFLLAKLMAIIMKLWYPIFATIINIGMIALFTVSVYGQIGPDYADPRYPSPAAWYFRYGCGLARPSGNYTNCQIAQSSLFITLYMFVVYLINFGFCLWAMWPNKANDIDEDEEDRESNYSEPKNMEMQGLGSPTTGGIFPYTPRTQAFHTLNRDLPLREPEAPKFG